MMSTDQQHPPPSRSIDTSGGTYVEGSVQIDKGDFIGRDQIINNVINKTDIIIQHTQSAAKQAKEKREIEKEYLAQGVGRFVQQLQARAQETASAGKGGPYKGLLEYRLSDVKLFFGRDEAIREFLEHLPRGPLTVLHSKSGAGKTSLLQAGIAPQLIAEEHLPVYLRPYNVDPALALKRALLPNLNDTPGLAAAPLRDFLWQVGSVLHQKMVLYIFLDQFEEFFIQLDEPACSKFVAELAECLHDTGLNVRWVLSLRTEFFGNLATFRPHIRSPFENDYCLSRLTRAEAQEVVTRPAAQRGIDFEPGLVNTLLDDLGQDVVAPPQVQLVCLALYEGLKQTDTTITSAMYKDKGSASGILRGHLDRVLGRDLPADQRPAARRLLEELVTSESCRTLRTRAELSAALAAHDVDEATLDAILSQMVDSRLLRIEEIGEDQVIRAYELAHDYLLEEIELDPAAQARKLAQELLAQEVKSHQRYGSLLSAKELSILEAQSEHLILNIDKLDLLFLSALDCGRSLDWWRDYALSHHLTAALAGRWIEALEGEDQVEANVAISSLVSLSDAETVSCLADLIKAQTPLDQTNPLRGSSLVQKRALAALAQMDCPEAETCLRQWTPEGFCFVPAGSFDMGSGERPEEQPQHPVQLAAFWIARLPVTVGDWRRFVEDGAYTQPRYWVELDSAEARHKPVPSGWKMQQDVDKHPVCNLTWYEAMAYSAWLAETSELPVALPTEAEWEKAAGWDQEAVQMRRYPWGDVPDASRCNVQGSGLGAVTLVGHYGAASASPCGAQDMAGNVLEWTHTEYRAYRYDADDGREAVSGNRHRVLRGGAFNRDIDDARCTHRHLLDPAIGLSSIGCRVCLRLAPLIPEGAAKNATNDSGPG